MTQITKQAKNQPAQSHPENPWLEAVKTIITAGILAFGIRTFVAEARYIPSSSMEPTLEINDKLIIEKISYHLREPARGDVVVFNTDGIPKLEEQFKEAFIKRVIGLPGEKIQVKNGRVHVNDKMLPENYIAQEPQYDYGPGIVPPGHYLVLGDNRNNSYDSHYWGFVPKENIIGRAAVRFWPPQRIGGINPIPTYAAPPQAN
jgi:signal peptidase I